MIRINLRPDMITTTIDGSGVSAPVEMVDTEIQRKGIVHILVMLILPAALYVYGAQAKPQKEKEIETLNAQIAELTAFNDKQIAIVTEIQKIEKDEKDVEKKIEAINSLSQGRLVEIQILDLLQTIIREKMWLKSVEIDGLKFSVDGMAQSEGDVTLFLNDLTRNVLLRDVKLLDANVEPYEGQNFTKFRITAIVEKSK